MGKTHVLPYKNGCYNIEMFEGGLIRRGSLDADIPCTLDDHDTRLKFSAFDFAANQTLYYKKYNDQPKRWEGDLEIDELLGSTTPYLKAFDNNRDTRQFKAHMILPRCDYGCENTNQRVLSLDLQPDDYPEETSWKVTNLCTGQIVQEGLAHGSDICVDANQQYSFTIEDREDDGICCRWGEGKYKLLYDGALIKEGGEFSTSETTVFGGTCV